jgi:hypothetical protein
MHIPQGSETLLRWSGSCPPATTAVFQETSSCRPPFLVENAGCSVKLFEQLGSRELAGWFSRVPLIPDNARDVAAV